ncbi:hypothetical protein EYF80_064668 [Liparis tanakae]|uniref:Uncharacterized protein n=1 Tax=Liparis tanakae TaxID=230148 RepID=A0A4Z2E9K6_9TELE|nr:hypothetical protein EYF80_064668 [Liparis tanakae]
MVISTGGAPPPSSSVVTTRRYAAERLHLNPQRSGGAGLEAAMASLLFLQLSSPHAAMVISRSSGRAGSGI